MIQKRVVITKVWRSELSRLVVFFILLVSSPILSRYFPGSIIRGELFSIGEATWILSLPLFWLLPAMAFINVTIRIYNVRYQVDSQGIEAWDGILSLRQTITKVRHEDIRSIETDQSLFERVLDTGDIYISTAATGDVEITFKGVASPKKLQNWLQIERDDVQKKSRRQLMLEETGILGEQKGEGKSEGNSSARSVAHSIDDQIVNEKI